MSGRLPLRSWTVPVILLATTLAAYGLFAAQQGYHWDDWGLIGIPSLVGEQALIDYFALARPLWGYFYTTSISLIGTNPFAWQVFALLMRWMAAMVLWWCLRLLWPRHARFTFVVSVFALVYPGFRQHSIAITYGHYSLMLALFYGSLGLSLWALRTQQKRTALIAAALILSALQLFSTEYFFGLELLRPILFWLVIGEKEPFGSARWKQTALAYLPYGLLVCAFVIWRGFFFESQLYQISFRPVMLLSLPVQVVRGIWNSLVLAWTGAFHLPPSDDMGTRLVLVYWGILLAVFVFFAYFPKILKTTFGDENGSTPSPILQRFGVGALAVLLAGIPFYVANLPIQLKFPNDRFTQPFAFGASILLAAGLEMLPRLSWRTWATGLFVALSAGLQIQSGFFFREDWKSQTAYFWQLAWRAPALKGGTAILSERAPFQFTDDDALSIPTNWMYMSGHSEAGQVHQVSMATRLDFQPETLQFNQPIEGRLFTGDFLVSPDALIAVQYSPHSCLHVLHPVYDADLPVAPQSREMTESLFQSGFPFLRREEAAVLPLLNMEQILAAPETPARPPEAIFGVEPPHRWCYYFEKADLARSQGDWAEVVRLGDEAFSIPYYPDNLSEYLPFVEAYARLGRFGHARKLTLDISRQMPILQPALCAVWQRVSAGGTLSEADMNLARQVQTDLQYCPVEKVDE